jgi:hypothetical protein
MGYISYEDGINAVSMNNKFQTPDDDHIGRSM